MYDSPYNFRVATPAGSMLLWLLGSAGLIAAVGITAYGFTKPCSNAGVSCTIDALLLQSLGLLGLFISAVLIVAGFALRSKARLKAQEERYQEFIAQLEEKKRKDPEVPGEETA